jgi:VIT1/CCC1 family predicted Fe2+/Mn2+ transporter
MPPDETDRIDDRGWLSAAALAAEFGLISTASLVVGVACASAERETVLVAAVAVLFSGAFSMAAEQYLSVATEADREQAALARQRGQLESDRLAETDAVHPLREAVAAAACFAVGAALPLLLVLLAPPARLVPLTMASSLVLLALLGALGARIDGAGAAKAVARVTLLGALAMGATALEGVLFAAAT